MVRVQSAAGVSPSISVQSGKSALRRDLRQQASRFALMSAIGLAAAAGGSLMTPGEALADCALNGPTVVCNTTGTTNTSHPVGQPNDRAYQVLDGSPLNASIAAGATVTGHGLAFSNLGDGGVSVVNDGTITVDAGNAPTAGGTAALSIVSNGGVLSYTGGAITNNGTGNGLDARQNGGNDTIDINATGAVRGAVGINALNNGGDAGGIAINAAAPVVGTVGAGIVAATLGGGGIDIAAGDVTGQGGAGIDAQLLNAPGSTNAVTISADDVVGQNGVRAFNSGQGGVSLTTTGNVTGLNGTGVFLGSSADVDANIGGVVTGSLSGVVVQAAGDISVQTAAVNALNGNGVTIDNQGAGEVNFAATGPINATGGHGVAVSDTAVGGDISVTTGAVSAMSATYNGIDVNSASATADITVVANGDIEAGNDGVSVFTAPGSTGNIDVTANGSISGARGIIAAAIGIGAVDVTAVGPITATNGAGIFAAAGAGGDVTVNAGDVSSANSVGVQASAAGSGDIDVTTGRVSGAVGIDATNTGDGATVVRAIGTVTGTTGPGIFIETDSSVELEIAGAVTGGTDGAFISAGNAGSGDISVTGAGGFVGLNGDGLDVRNQGSGRVEIDISGATSATNGHGVIVADTAIGGDISITTGAVTANSAGWDGINVESASDTANISVTVNGDVEAGRYGVNASLASGSTGNIDVMANGSITGDGGILALTEGTGSVSVTAVGPITAMSDYGISAGSLLGGDVTINAGDVTSSNEVGVGVFAADGGDIDVTTGNVSGTVGISSANNGDGATVIRTNGTVTGTDAEGIAAAAAHSLRLELADMVTGATFGAFIRAGGGGAGDISVAGAGGFVGLDGSGLDVENEGAGRTDIDISGSVSATNGSGLDVRNFQTDGGDINVTTGNVTALSAGYGAISVSSSSLDADVSITANGDVAGAEYGVAASISDGLASGNIQVTTSGAVTGNYGIDVRNVGSGSVSVDASGPVTAVEVGIQAQSEGGDVTVAAGDVAADGDYGIFARQRNAAGAGIVDVTTTGAISGLVGIRAANAGSGSVAVNASGPITAGENGIEAITQGGDITVAAGDVSAAGDYGIFAQQQNAAGAGNIDITTTGAISGDLSGIFAINDGSGAVSVNAAGPVTGREDIGIFAGTMGGDVTVVAGDVSGDFYGVRAIQVNQAATGDIDIATTGAVSGEVGVGAFNAGSGVVSINASGPITATGIGILAQTSGGAITVAAGAVASTGEFGIFAQQADAGEAGEIDIAATGPVSSGTHGIRVLNAGSGATRIAAAGTVTGAAGTGIEARGAAIEVTVGGMVTGDDYGLLVNGGIGGTGDISVSGAGGFAAANEDAVFIFNAGTGTVTYDVSGPVSSTTGSGVVVADTGVGGDISVTTGSVTAMTAGRNAIFVDSVSTTADVTIVANGALSAGGDAVRAVLRDDATGDINVTTRAAVTGENGIVAVNLGTGSTTVTSEGLVTATGTGIFATAVEGDVTVVAGDVTADGPVGIEAGIGDGGTGDLSVTAGDVSGGVGIRARNDGAGALTVVANGAITGTDTDGIQASGESAVTVTVADMVSGERVGLNLAGGIEGDGDILVTGAGGFSGQTGAAAYIQNFGTGTVTFNVAGPMSSAESSGLVIEDTALGGDISVVTGDVAALADNAVGIDIRSASTTADIDLTVNGDLQAGSTGLIAQLGAAATGDINVLTNGAVTALQGIFARNSGAGSVTVASTGPITAADLGINAASQGGDVTVAAGDVAGDFAIVAVQQNAAGAGDVAVTATGEISGGIGVLAQNDGSGSVSVNASGPITTGDLGITARSQGGDISIAAASVSGDATYGIHAFQRNAAGAGDIDITATGAVTGGIHGILASNAGSGEIRITTTGTVSSAANGFYGIRAFATDASGDVVIDANNVSGADAGIRVDNNGVGVTDLTVRGLVQGGTVGVSVFSDDDQDVRIANQGVIRNASGLSSDRAIEASGGFIDFTNTGTLTGDINFQGDSSVFDNRGTWNAAGGDSSFATGDDELINAATGSILAGSTAAAQDLTVFRGLETFRNAGRLTMNDNGAGDVVMTSADTVFAAGSLLQVDIAGQALADLFATTGTLTLEAGARLDVNFVLPLALSGRYVVARADGGLTGTFDFEDRLLSAFIGLRDGYTATTAYLEIGQLRPLMEAGLTPNQRETGAGADSLPLNNPLKGALLLLPDDETARDAFDQSSGEIHPAVRRAMADDSRQFRGAVLDRLSDERGAGVVWGRVLVEERNTDGDGNAAKVEHDARGLILGVDRDLTDNLTVGFAGGWFNTDLDIVRRNSSGQTQSQQALAYLGARMDRWGLRAGVGYAKTSTDTRREIAFPGFSASPTADYDGSVLQSFLEAAYRLPLHGGYVEPFANLTAITADTDAFHEVDGPAALAVEARSEDLTATTLGFRFQTVQSSGLSLRGTAGWRNLSGDLTPAGRHAFDGGATFTVLGVAQSDTAAVGNLEAQWRLSPNVTLGAAWDGVFGNEGQDHTLTGRFTLAF